MRMSVSIGGIGTSAARMRALALVRDAIAKREAEAQGERRASSGSQNVDQHQHMRGK